MNQYPFGQTVCLQSTFLDDSQNPVDPNYVNLRYMDAAGNLTTWTYGVDTQIVRTGVGVYKVEFNAPQSAGNVDEVFSYRWFTGQVGVSPSIGEARAAADAEIKFTGTPLD